MLRKNSTFAANVHLMTAPFRLTVCVRPILFLCSLMSAGKSMAQKTTTYGPGDIKDTVTRGFKPNVGSDRYYRIYVGASYNIVKYKGGKTPYAASHTIGLNYSITENSFHPYYESFYPQAIGNWNLAFKAGYDGIRRVSYYGLGNETHRESTDDKFNWVRSHHQYAALGVSRTLASHHQVDLDFLYDGIQVLNDENRYIGKSRQTIDPADFNWQYFVGSRLSYAFTTLDIPEFPMRGVSFKATAGYKENLNRGGHSFARYTGDLSAYLPLPSYFTYVFRTGFATLSGQPDFYQYNAIGGTQTLRGYQWWRFYGKTSFYNQNELRWLVPVQRGSISGHFGLLGFYDLGRVWMPGEESNKLHYGYGVGIILAPLDRFVFTLMYGISNEDKRLNTSLGGLD